MKGSKHWTLGNAWRTEASLESVSVCSWLIMNLLLYFLDVFKGIQKTWTSYNETISFRYSEWNDFGCIARTHLENNFLRAQNEFEKAKLSNREKYRVFKKSLRIVIHFISNFFFYSIICFTVIFISQ